MLTDTFKISLDELVDFLRGYLPAAEPNTELRLLEYTFERAQTFYDRQMEIGSFWVCSKPNLKVFAPLCIEIRGRRSVNIVQYPAGIPSPIEDETPTASILEPEEG